MNKPIKAASLSFFIYPGAGQFSLKKYANAAFFIILFSIPFFWTLFEMFEQTNHLMNSIIEKNLPLNAATLTEIFSSLVTQYSQSADNKTSVMVVIWLLSTADAYRLAYYQKSKTLI